MELVKGRECGEGVNLIGVEEEALELGTAHDWRERREGVS